MNPTGTIIFGALAGVTADLVAVGNDNDTIEHHWNMTADSTGSFGLQALTLLTGAQFDDTTEFSVSFGTALVGGVGIGQADTQAVSRPRRAAPDRKPPRHPRLRRRGRVHS